MKEQDRDTEEKKGRGRRALYITAALLLSLALFGAGFAGGYFSVDRRARSLAEMADLVAKNYLGGAEEEDLYDRMYDALELDKFCTHYTPAEYERVLAESEGEGEGYGFSLSALEETPRVYNAVYNSPAERAGIASGMYITRYGPSEEELKTGTVEETLAFLRSSGSCVLECGFRSDGSDGKLYALSRESYLASYVSYIDAEGTYRFRGENKLTLTRVGEGVALPGDTAYIRLAEFDGNAAAEFTACLEKMREAGRSGLVLDLRRNGGGYLDLLCRIASHLLRNANGKRPLVATAPDYGNISYYATGNDFSSYFEEDSRIRVLLDENSASASESLVSAMLDYGTVTEDDLFIRIGEDGEAHSYGKGVMQAHFSVPDGNVMRLTVSRILSPSGRCIHGTGFVAVDGAHSVQAPLLPEGENDFLCYLVS